MPLSLLEVVVAAVVGAVANPASADLVVGDAGFLGIFHRHLSFFPFFLCFLLLLMLNSLCVVYCYLFICDAYIRFL